MSKSSSIRRTIGLLFVFAVCVVFVCADLVVSSASIAGQNTNSSTTMQDESTRGGMMTSNSNTATTTTATPRRRKRRPVRATAVTATDAAMTPGQDDAGMKAADMSGTQTDLSGTYTGTVNYPEGGVTGPATLTITGTTFTLAPDGGGAAISGTVTAVTTRGYTGVTMMFGDRTPPPITQSPPPLPAVSLRARMAGGGVTLMNVPGEKREFSFASAGAMKAKPKRRRASPVSVKSETDPNRSMDTVIKPPTAAATP